MARPAEDALFLELRPSHRRVATALLLAIGVLLLNAAADDRLVSVAGAVAGAVLFVAAPGAGRRRAIGAVLWIALLGGAAIVVAAVGVGEREALLAAAARMACGVIWTVWIGSQIDWPSLRDLLLRLRVPEPVVETLDQALLHGFLTVREWGVQRDAARARLGRAHLPLATWGPLLGEGALRAYVRLEATAENSQLRGADASAPDLASGVHVEQVDVERNRVVALRDVSLRLVPGEWVAVCGPSGSGKSTLLRLLAGLERPLRGSVTRFGARFGAESPLRERLDRRVALLSQNPEHHFIASTVAEDIAWGLRKRGVAAAETQRRTRSMAQSLELELLLERPCHELSFGEQRRVALAGLLVLDPALLLLDEPTAGLDPVAAQALCAQIREVVARTACACVWATHDLAGLPREIERVVLLHDQRLLFEGPRGEGLSVPWLRRCALTVD